LAEHVTESVLCYFATSYDKGIVSLADTCEIVRSVLQAIGYGEVSIHYEALNPPFELSLAEIAREAGAGFELGFFQLLRERLQPALSDRASNVHISGLQNCVRLLQSAKTWSRSCSQLRNEIVDFLRAQMIQAEVKSDVLLTIR
jgi:hypothetical protein